ncbi:HK97-gp10 family putative phage morphogenesis protein [Enterococcus sp. DIV1283b]|uniref:HK97-gp10 family putative phage morphogenesis protein n=1 Tax=Enterococcus sp. DIV1283b TaxID=2774745 RepID=UPI003F2560C7
MANNFIFTSYKEKVKKQLEEAGLVGMEKVLRIIRAAAKASAPVATGQLRDRIDFAIKTASDEIIGAVGSPEEYAIYIEFGTGEFAENGNGRKGGWVYKDPSGEWYFTWGQDPQPFLRPAFRQNKETIKEILGQEYGARFGGK